jgi:hypothetical protein
MDCGRLDFRRGGMPWHGDGTSDIGEMAKHTKVVGRCDQSYGHSVPWEGYYFWEDPQIPYLFTNRNAN